MAAAEIAESEKVESVRPPEILSQILRLAVGSDGVKALLPFIHVSTQWRHAALCDSFLWTTIHLKQTNAALLDLWKLFARVEELHYTLQGVEELVPFLTSLGPAPNLKTLYLQPGLATGPIQTVAELPIIFSGYLPSLRSITFSNTIAWSAGLFKGLVSFEYGAVEQYPISAFNVLDVLQYSPSIEFLRLVGSCRFPFAPDARAVAFPSLVNCTLIGDGTTALIQFITLPATAVVSLSKSGFDDESFLPKFNDYSVAPGLRALGEMYAVSLFVGDCAVGIRARNRRGGVLDAKVKELCDQSGSPSAFTRFIRRSLESWRTCPGFDTTKELTLSMERGRIWEAIQANYLAMNIIGFIFNLPSVSVEEIKLLGVPPRELSLILEFLCSLPQLSDLCPNLKRLHIETTPLRSPWSLLAGFGGRLADRKKAWAPFQSVVVKVRCEMLIPATDHCALLAAWGGFVTEGVRLEYERAEVRRLPRCPRSSSEDDDEGGGDEGGGDEGDEDEGATIVDLGHRCVGWDGWPGNWPMTIEEASERQTESM